MVASAQATRTWVSGVGDDVNPCSRTAPCKTFAGAISKTAKNGEINCLDPGGFGAVTITKSLTIDCASTEGGISAAGAAAGITISITDPADTRKLVRLRGLDINGFATGVDGIRVLAATGVSIDNVTIEGFTGDGLEVTGASNVVVRDSTIRSATNGIRTEVTSGGFGTIMMFNSNITHCTTGVLSGNNGVVGLLSSFIIFNGTGLSTKPGGVATNGGIFSYGNNVIDGNGTNGTPTGIPLK
jgi:hypothetical protein